MGKNFVAGLGAGVVEALVVVAPVETVKTKCIGTVGDEDM